MRFDEGEGRNTNDTKSQASGGRDIEIPIRKALQIQMDY